MNQERTSATMVEGHVRLILGLMATAYAEIDLEARERLIIELAAAQTRLERLRQERQEGQDAKRAGEGGERHTMGQFLGPNTTDLEVRPVVKMDPIPTGIYHLLRPEDDPLVEVTIVNKSFEPRRLAVSAHIEGLSTLAIKTVEFEREEVDHERTIRLLPTLRPSVIRRLNVVQRCTLHVRVEIFGTPDGKDSWASLVESHDTYTPLCLSRNSSFNSVIDPETGRPKDLTRYYGAWVTPHIEPIQALVRKAAEKVPGRAIWGYQGRPDPGRTEMQVRALFETLKDVGITYVNSIIDFGAPVHMATQRTRLPRESIKHRSANCIDGTVLMASLLECAALHAAIVLVPGHAFVGWEKWQGSNEWDYLETTLIDSGDFEKARESAWDLYRRIKEDDSFDVHGQKMPLRLELDRLRAEKIWPME